MANGYSVKSESVGPGPAWTPPRRAIAAGWYLDPQHLGWLRYWNGSGWTRHVSPLELGAPVGLDA